MAAVPAIAIGFWYAVFFLPHVGDLKKMAKQGREAIQNAESILYPLAVAAETKNGIRSWAIRQASSSRTSHGSTLSRQLNSGLWHAASYIHFTDREVFGIWVECSLYSCGRGLKEAAQKHYGKELKTLSERQLASLVAMVKSPTRYAPGTESGVQRTNEILERSGRNRGGARTPL